MFNRATLVGARGLAGALLLAWGLAPLAACGGPEAGAGGAGGAGGGAAVAGAQAGAEPSAAGPRARFEPAADLSATPLAALPFPHDAYREGARRDAPLRLGAFAGAQGVLRRLVDAIEAETPGFGTSSGLYLSFEEPIDTSPLPRAGGDALRDDAALALVDVDPSSPERGRRWPLMWRFSEEPTATLPANTLSVRLLEGIALRPRTTYALLVTTAVGAPAPAFEECLAAEPPADAAREPLWRLYEPLRAYLAERGGAQPPLAVASVFTTQDPVSELFTLAARVAARPAPEGRALTSEGVTAARVDYEVFRGRYTAPRFQEGTIPYQTAGGAIRFDERGEPIEQGEEDLRFSLAVPADEELPMPEEGWPVALYAHGTGGDYESYLRGDVALTLARQGVAVISIDQIHHGERDGGACAAAADYAQCVSLLFFNFLVPAAGRDNVRQSAIDLVSLRRMVSGLRVPAEVSAVGRAARFNASRVMFMGHSQGGLNGPLFMAVDPEVRGGVLSGAGSNIAISLEQKVKPFNVNQLIRAALGLPATEVLDRWHPALALLQMFIEPGDSSNYGRFWFAEPPEGWSPKSVFMTVGLEDDYTPPETTFALAVSGRVPLVLPVLRPIEALEFLGVEPASLPPYSGNVAGGQASAGLAQFEGLGHFVVFESASAKERYGSFLRDLATRLVPKVY